MNGENNQRKDSTIKTLAIIGFTATIVLGVWLAVQVVQLAPSAFSSLASLSESVYGKPGAEEITVVTSKSVVNNTETFELRWSEVERPGQYRFTYECVDGVDVLIKNQIGSISGINSISEILPSSIPMIRTTSAKLFVFFPMYSQKLSELSVHLGSIILDSAALTKARFDFSKSNHISTILLDEVKLMADSKLNKQYPLVDFSKLFNT